MPFSGDNDMYVDTTKAWAVHDSRRSNCHSDLKLEMLLSVELHKHYIFTCYYTNIFLEFQMFQIVILFFSKSAIRCVCVIVTFFDYQEFQ